MPCISPSVYTDKLCAPVGGSVVPGQLTALIEYLSLLLEYANLFWAKEKLVGRVPYHYTTAC